MSNKRKTLILSSTSLLALSIFLTAPASYAAEPTKEKKSVFSRIFSRKKTQQATELQIDPKHSIKDKLKNLPTSCGTNCADDKYSFYQSAKCAFTHPRVPMCMKNLSTKLEAINKNYGLKHDGALEELTKFEKTYYNAVPFFRTMVRQLAANRVADEAAFKARTPVLSYLYNKVIKNKFLADEGKEREKLSVQLREAKATKRYFGYIFQVDSLQTLRVKGGKRKVHGVILHSPVEESLRDGIVSVNLKGSNYTGRFFEYEKPQNEQLELNKFVIIPSRAISDVNDKNSFEFKIKSKLKTKKHQLPVELKITQYETLEQASGEKAPPLPPRNKTARQGSASFATWDNNDKDDADWANADRKKTERDELTPQLSDTERDELIPLLSDVE